MANIIDTIKKIINKCIHYLQWDKRWKNIKYSTHTSKQTIGNSGCGPSAVAMIVAQFCDPSVTPVEMCKWSVENGYRTWDSGTDWGLFDWVFKHFKFARYKPTNDIDILKQALADGALAVGSMNGNDNHFWTTGGHFITIIGYDSDGYIYANDPNKSECPRKQHQSKFKSCLKKAFIYWPTHDYDPDTLRRGDYGSKVKEMQQLLLKWDAKCLPKYGADSDFGGETYNALVAFQKQAGIEATGVYDKATRDALTGWTPTPTPPTPTPEPTPTRREATETADPDKIWKYLLDKIGNPYGVAGLMGNLRAESALRSCNLQQTYETKLGYTDATYTKAVDDGSYKNFASDKAGYGLAQWTSDGRKKNLLAYAKETNSSIGNLDMQLEFLIKELTNNYKTVLSTLKNAKSVREASDVVLLKYEIPANKGESVQVKRASYGTEYYNKYCGGSDADDVILKKGDKGEAVEELQRLLIEAVIVYSLMALMAVMAK